MMNKHPLRTAVLTLLVACPLFERHTAKLLAWEPNASELEAAIGKGDFAGYATRLSTWLDQKTPAVDQITEATMTALVKEPAFRNVLDQRQFLASHGADKLKEFAKDQPRKDFVAWIMKSTPIMDQYLEAVATTDGKIGDGGIKIDVLERWHRIYTEDPDSRDGVYRKLAMATALCKPGGRCTYRDEQIDWFKRYQHFKTAHQNKELVPSFDHLIVVDYCKVVSSTASDADLAWGRKMIATWRPDLLDKEQINKVVSEVWRRNSPIPFDNGYVTVLEGGGKCGPRGAFGAFICQAHGIPAITVGQPAHFCFAARADFPETEPQVGSVWKVYQGRGWHVSDCGNNMYGPAFLADMTRRYRTAELSTIAHLDWLASALASRERADALRALAVRVRKPVNTSQPLGVPSTEVDVMLAGQRLAVQSPKPQEATIDINKEGPSPKTAASAAGLKPPRVKEEPIRVAPGVIHVEAETFSAKSPGVTVYDCTAGGKQVNFHKSIQESWLDYAIDVPATGTYSLEVMLATANRGQVLHVSSGKETLGTVTIPGTIGLWKKMAPVELQLKEGRTTLRLSAPFQRGVAVRWFELTPKRRLVWDTKALCEAPKMHPTTQCPVPGVRAFYFEGADYKGEPTRVFAYYAAPEGNPPAGGWPAAVCAHGGGGTAYPDWVKTWNQHGYAAISMDLEGHLPDGRGHDHAGPARIDWFGDRDLPDREQWFYHAVADVIRANSLLRSFPEINKDKIGLTGISWGGTIVGTTAGVDPRFAFVVPVYGCGYIHQSDNDGLAIWFPPRHMTAKQFEDYCTKWDPSAHLPFAKMPMLWMTGFDDPVFQVDIFSRSAKAAGGPSALCIRGRMLHGHGVGWQKADLYAFADSVVKGGKPLPSLGRPEFDPQTRIVRVKTTGKLAGASVHYTVHGGKWKGRDWEDIPCEIGADEATGRKPLPEGVTALNVNAKDDRGLLISSEIVEVAK